MRRYGFSLNAVTAWPAGVYATDGRQFAWGWLYRVEAEANVFADGIPGLVLLPSLHVPTDRLPQAVLDFFVARGVVPSAGDTLLNMLRALRDAGGENGRSFDVSSQD